ncbi:unnamed protein product [Hermetia illucens]|uniref:Uncharacterized protein n=1 Tax=Hermetia illucens TaxID=343691 RepID=A0A7R8UKZ4_HERIL|nr:unnamed protein product [Hermetia illucens]
MAVPFYIPDQAKLRQQNNRTVKSGVNIPISNNALDNSFSWELIARAFCDALKEYYLQSLAARSGFMRISFEFKPNEKLKGI